jgi:hypothetical protein
MLHRTGLSLYTHKFDGQKKEVPTPLLIGSLQAIIFPMFSKGRPDAHRTQQPLLLPHFGACDRGQQRTGKEIERQAWFWLPAIPQSVRFPDIHAPSLAALQTEGGTVFMPLDRYPFSEKFGWIADKYGVSWQLNLQGN